MPATASGTNCCRCWSAITIRRLRRCLPKAQRWRGRKRSTGRSGSFLWWGSTRARRRRLVRRAAEVAGVALHFHHVEQVLGVAAADSAGKEIELPGGYHAVRRGQELRFERRSTPASAPYEHVLAIPGEVRIPALGLAIRATRVEKRGYNREQQ